MVRTPQKLRRTPTNYIEASTTCKHILRWNLRSASSVDGYMYNMIICTSIGFFINFHPKQNSARDHPCGKVIQGQEEATHVLFTWSRHVLVLLRGGGVWHCGASEGVRMVWMARFLSHTQRDPKSATAVLVRYSYRHPEAPSCFVCPRSQP